MDGEEEEKWRKRRKRSGGEEEGEEVGEVLLSRLQVKYHRVLAIHDHPIPKVILYLQAICLGSNR